MLQQKDRLVAKPVGLGLLGINEPGNMVCYNNIRLDLRPLALVAKGSSTEAVWDELHVWIKDEACHSSSWQYKSLPPVPILKCTETSEFNKLWGWDRLLAYDVGCELKDPSDMSMYESYLEKFYSSNSHHINGGDAIFKCLENEKALRGMAKTSTVFDFDMELSKDIEQCMSNLANDAGSQSRQPFSTYAAACIMKEAELMIQWLSQESAVSDEEYETSNGIRQCALDLAMFEGDCNAQTAALLLGITKEAEFLLKSVKSGCLISTDISTYIRIHASNFLYDKYCELESAATEINQPEYCELESAATEINQPEYCELESAATEINQPTRGNTESVSFGKNDMQEQFDQIIPDLSKRLVPFKAE